MSPTPLISIIVPVYNSEKYIRRCIESLLKQEYSNIEIIIINDGSSDNSLLVAEEYLPKDNRIRIINQKNSGVSKARNIGIDNVTGEYICFVDSDDYVEHNYISNFYIGLQNDVDLVFQGLNEIHLDKSVRRIIPDQGYYQYAEVLNGIADINKHRMFGYVCNKLYKTSIIRKNNLKFPEDINLSEDRIFALKYLKFVNNMQVVSLSGYNYELQESGLTLKNRSYKEIKKAADTNLKEAFLLLKNRNSNRFEHDTRRMYVMSAIGYMHALFQENNSWETRYKEVKKFRKSYYGWLNEYKPVNRNQKIILKSLYLPSSISILIQTLYCQIKRIYEKNTKISKL